MARDLVFEIEGLVPEPITVALRADLKISNDIDTEIDVAAINFGYYAILSEKANTRYQKIKFAFEAWVASTEAAALRIRQAEAKKPYTEAQMKAYVRSQTKYRGFQMRMIEYDEQQRILKVISKAFEMKKDLVQTKAANRRGEIRTPSGK